MEFCFSERIVNIIKEKGMEHQLNELLKYGRIEVIPDRKPEEPKKKKHKRKKSKS